MKIIIILIIIYLISTYIMFLLCSRKIEVMHKVIDKKIGFELSKYDSLIQKGLDWMEKTPKKDIYLKTKDNKKIHAIYIDNPKSNAVLILCHGYRSTAKRDVYPSCYNYYKLGLSLLIVDHRTSNLSEGKYITFGNKEAEDLKLWINYIYKKKKNILLGGVSMGATISLLLANNKKVKGIIADSAYQNAYEEVGYVVQRSFYMPKRLVMPMINTYFKIITKTNLKKIDTIEVLKESKVPVFFIHGLDDQFVPVNNSLHNYDSYTGEKKILLVENANHGMGYLVEPEKYIRELKKFISKIV